MARRLLVAATAVFLYWVWQRRHPDRFERAVLDVYRHR
jgi:hypothetical protein